MISREMIIDEIQKVPDEPLDELYRIIKDVAPEQFTDSNLQTVFSMKKCWTRTILIVALLFLSLLAFDKSPAALSKNREANRRLDITFNPVVDLSYMVRK